MRLTKYFQIILFSIAVTACSSKSESKLTIAAAANMQLALTDITKAFTQETGIEVEVILSSSGKLNAQIKEGAPYHVFVSADMQFPQDLYETGFTEEAPKVYANGTLVLWSFQDEIHPSFKMLKDPNIKHVAVANPKTAPYGIAAEQFLKRTDTYESIQSKLVFGESVGQTNQFIITGAAELGLTAKSVVMSPQMKNKGHWIEIPNKLHDPIAQGVVLLKSSPEMKENATLFYTFLFSENSKNILVNYGYQVP